MSSIERYYNSPFYSYRQRNEKSGTKRSKVIGAQLGEDYLKLLLDIGNKKTDYFK